VAGRMALPGVVDHGGGGADRRARSATVRRLGDR